MKFSGISIISIFNHHHYFLHDDTLGKALFFIIADNCVPPERKVASPRQANSSEGPVFCTTFSYRHNQSVFTLSVW